MVPSTRAQSGKVIGEIVDQAPMQPGLSDEAVQEHAYEPIHKCVGVQCGM